MSARGAGTINSYNWMPSDLPLICRKRSRLLRDYTDAAIARARNVREMAEFVRSGDEAHAREARRRSRTLLEAAEKFRLSLYRHEADHSCDRMADLENISETPPEPLSPHYLEPQPTEIPELSSQPLLEEANCARF
jgi:hypothetical protein